MIERLNNKYNYLAPLKYNRIRNYIKNLEDNIIIKNKKDKQTITEIKELIDFLIKKLKNYYRLNSFLYFAIYFSFISYIFSDMLIISDLAEIFGKVIGILGTTVFFIALYFSNRIIDLYYQDLNLITAHLISVYSKYEKDNIDEVTDVAENYYKTFIKFFKNRGF